MLSAFSARAGAVGVAAVVAAACCTVSALLAAGTGLGERIWPGHSVSLRSSVMADIGRAAAASRYPGTSTMRDVERLAARAATTPEPFLIEAAVAEKRGDYSRATGLLIDARGRAPRSAAARFLLADIYLRTGQILPALRELAVLRRLIPGFTAQLTPILTEYARTPGAIPVLKQILTENSDIRPTILSVLADDASNANLVLALAGATEPGSQVDSDWQAHLLNSLTRAGKYTEAYAIWLRMTGQARAPAGLYNSDFAANAAPPPFNWRLAQAGGGLAEAAPGGGMHVIYYGREDLVFAAQIVLLPSGFYRLSMHASGDVGGERQLRWTVKCLPGQQPLFALALAQGQGRAEGQFSVPDGDCPAQLIELSGVGEEFPKSSDVTIRNLRLSRVAAP